ncbi:MAG: AMP-binding protein [Candidatus Krumholzibacteria bacterium]|nr:AMP-binding protein [Candidatus Krumholzibacteria bacterium]
MLKENFVDTIGASINKHWDVSCFSDLNGETITYGELAHRIFRIHYIIAEAGLKKGDRVGLAGRNSANWCVTYLAAVTCGAVIVPILPDFKSAEIEHLVRHSECKLLFVPDSIHDRLDEDKMQSLRGIFHLGDFSLAWSRDKKLPGVVDAAEAGYRERYETMLADHKVRFPQVSNADMAAIVYTSGTTGFSKGVMLTGNALIANILYFLSCIELAPGDNVVSFLPLAHAFGCAFDFLAPMAAGCHITYIEKIPTPKVLVAAFAAHPPVYVMSVPLVIEKIYRNRIKPILETPKVKLMLKVPGINKLVYKKIHDQIYEVFGGRFKEMVIGGAAINKDIEDFFRKIGLRMTCGYGMTECGPLMSYTVYDELPPVGSVGKIIPYLEGRIHKPDPNTGIGEVQVRGENLMLGYYNDEEATAETINPEGWLMTGDLGRLDEEGHLYLTGRSKNMILTTSGQNVYPEEIESQLNNLPCVEESLILENDGKLLALVYPDLESVDRACLKGKQVETLMEENRKSLNVKLPGFSQIARLKVLYEEFEKTPTKKIKRRLYNALS